MFTREKLYTAEEFFELARLPENENRRLELDNGVIVEMASLRPINTVIATRISHFLNAHVIPNNLGYVAGADGGFKLANGRVRQPDVAFVSIARYPTLPIEFHSAPDLAVEVVLPHEDVLKKVDEYLASGTHLIWAIYPDEQIVHVFRQTEPRWQTLTIQDTLSGENVLPDFSLDIKDIFPSQG